MPPARKRAKKDAGIDAILPNLRTLKAFFGKATEEASGSAGSTANASVVAAGSGSTTSVAGCDAASTPAAGEASSPVQTGTSSIAAASCGVAGSPAADEPPAPSSIAAAGCGVASFPAVEEAVNVQPGTPATEEEMWLHVMEDAFALVPDPQPSPASDPSAGVHLGLFVASCLCI